MTSLIVSSHFFGQRIRPWETYVIVQIPAPILAANLIKSSKMPAQKASVIAVTTVRPTSVARRSTALGC